MASDILVEPLHLKLRELLNEVQLDYSPAFTTLVDDTISAIKEAISKIPEGFQVGADEAPGFVKDLSADKVAFKFKKPTTIEVGGSYAIRCIAKPDVNIDLFVRLPKDCFHEKDYLRYRYHGKRCLYLCIIKKYLKSSSLLGRIEWSALQNEARKPILVVYPATASAEIPAFCVRIIPTATSLFSLAKLNATRNNIRALQKGDVSEATPKYNCSILEDMLMEELAEFVRGAFVTWKELGEALILLKVWARQRTSIYGHDCLNGYLISILMACLATEPGRRRINKSMNAMQIFRVTLDFIANSKLWENGLSLWFPNEAKITKEKLHSELDPTEEMKERKQRLQSFPGVICDPSGYFNLAFRLSKTGFTELRNEASLTGDCLEKCRGGGFEETFLTKIDFPAKYDYCIRLNLKGNAGVHTSGYCMDDECWRLYEEKTRDIISQGLSNRAKLIRVLWRNWIPNYHIEDGFSSLDKEPLLVGITIDTFDKSLRVVDIGPDAENKEEVARFLRLLSEFVWRFYPLVVDINNDLTPEDEKEINENFLLSRKGYEDNPQSINHLMFLATEYDRQSEAWTASSPNSAELKRLVAYARSSGNLLSQLILQDQNDPYGWERIFRTPLNNYDAVVLLHGDKLAHPERCLFLSEVNQGLHVARGNATKDFNPLMVRKDMKGGSLDQLKMKLMVDFDPLRCFLVDLEEEYGDTFKLWYDALGGDAIGLTWSSKPTPTSKKRGREENGNDDDIVNVLKSVGETGKGFVRSVHLLKAPKAAC
ncbi:hypothetical protein Dimus_014191 [Dionaea muscipula]